MTTGITEQCDATSPKKGIPNLTKPGDAAGVSTGNSGVTARVSNTTLFIGGSSAGSSYCRWGHQAGVIACGILPGRFITGGIANANILVSPHQGAFRAKSGGVTSDRAHQGRVGNVIDSDIPEPDASHGLSAAVSPSQVMSPLVSPTVVLSRELPLSCHRWCG
jgi:hypothetical protein